MKVWMLVGLVVLAVGVAWMVAFIFDGAKKLPRKLQADDVAVIESAIDMRLPSAGAVADGAILHGKDTYFFLRLKVSEKLAAEMLEDAPDSWDRARTSRAFVLGDVPAGFQAAEGNVVSAFSRRFGRTSQEMVFCRPERGVQSIYILSVGPIPSRVAQIFEN